MINYTIILKSAIILIKNKKLRFWFWNTSTQFIYLIKILKTVSSSQTQNDYKKSMNPLTQKASSFLLIQKLLQKVSKYFSFKRKSKIKTSPFETRNLSYSISKSNVNSWVVENGNTILCTVKIKIKLILCKLFLENFKENDHRNVYMKNIVWVR